jgi:histidyl-tRNA synthetase
VTSTLKAVRGMHDTLPDASACWQFLEQTVNQVLTGYGYQQIRLPVVEKTELFERSLGETTDIVSKEMYTFADKSGEMLTLRPEGTASCVRAGLEHGLFQNPALRLWYTGPMFRHERPQKGRLRQFHQIGIETYGLAGPDIDAEIITMSARIWKLLGLDDLELQLNSLGSNEARRNYRDVLVEYFQGHRSLLDEDSLNRLEKNPLRILDSKNPDMQDLISKAPNITDSLDSESADHFTLLQSLLDAVGIRYSVNPRLVRGLDYYNRTVFEWVTNQLGAQGTVCAGGRYDGLVEKFGGPSTPAIGFAMGVERLVSLIENNPAARIEQAPQVYFIVASQNAMATALTLSEQLRNELPGLRLIMHCGGGSFKSQFKKADKSGAEIALIIGDNELAQQRIGIKPLRTESNQYEVAWADLVGTVRQILSR